VQPVHDARQVARGDQEPARELHEREPVALAVELVQDVELRKRQCAATARRSSRSMSA
jgi:hypothetical protein